MTRDPRRAYRVVDDFELELADYTGAPFAVTVDSCTNAIYLALTYERLRLRREHRIHPNLTPDLWQQHVALPKHTYVGVLQAARNADYEVLWTGEWDEGQNYYTMPPTHIFDCARRLFPNMYVSTSLTCLSFHAAKQLPLGRGGAILTDSAETADWFKAARMDGRPPGAPIQNTIFPGFHCPLPPDTAARGLWTLSRWNDTNYTPPPLPPETYPDLSQL